MSGPDFESQFLNLSPRSKVAVGLLLACVSGVGCAKLWDSGWISGTAVFVALFGLALASIGLRERARERAFDAEVGRARAEWGDLEAGIRAARREGGNVARYLQGKGYREFAVRRWIAAELEPDRQADQPPSP